MMACPASRPRATPQHRTPHSTPPHATRQAAPCQIKPRKVTYYHGKPHQATVSHISKPYTDQFQATPPQLDHFKPHHTMSLYATLRRAIPNRPMSKLHHATYQAMQRQAISPKPHYIKAPPCQSTPCNLYLATPCHAASNHITLSHTTPKPHHAKPHHSTDQVTSNHTTSNSIKPCHANPHHNTTPSQGTPHLVKPHQAMSNHHALCFIPTQNITGQSSSTQHGAV